MTGGEYFYRAGRAGGGWGRGEREDRKEWRYMGRCVVGYVKEVCGWVCEGGMWLCM